MTRDDDTKTVVNPPPAYYWYFWKKTLHPPFAELAADNPKSEIYRFGLRPSFGRPLGITLIRQDGTAQLKYSDVVQDHGSFRLNEDATTITEDGWLEFTRILDETSFWRSPAETPWNRMKGGDTWILEGCRCGESRRVERRGSGNLYKPGLHLARLAGFDRKRLLCPDE